jgi:nucleoid-associated protein YgaU
MRGLALLAILAGAFGLAAWWQQRHVAELRAAQAAVVDAAPPPAPLAGEDELAPGEAVLIVGRPSGAEPRPRSRPAPPPAPGPDAGPPADDPLPEDEAGLGDYLHTVQPGQTLSGIAHLRYGRSDPGLVQALADYNGLESPDRLRAGQPLRLPAAERLETGSGR